MTVLRPHAWIYMLSQLGSAPAKPYEAATPINLLHLLENEILLDYSTGNTTMKTALEIQDQVYMGISMGSNTQAGPDQAHSSSAALPRILTNHYTLGVAMTIRKSPYQVDTAR